MRGLDELMSVEVSSVSRKEQRLADTSAAVFVVSRDDIRRSGMRTVADVLRLVPGLHVAQIDGNKWAVSARGMNGRYASKLLVMIDGRSIYTPFHAGVSWDAIDVPVHVIERIEVVRGPGASVWGANAVNGVINIITTGAATRRETVVSAGLGSVDFGTVLHSGRVGDRVGYRLFADMAGYNPFELADGSSANDDWRQQRFGGSLSATLNARDTFEASLRATDGRSDSLHPIVTDLAPFTITPQQLSVEADVWSASGQWTRQLRNQGHLQVQGFVDAWSRADEVDHHRRTYDIGVQHRLGLRGRHDVLWGGGYRQTDETSIGSLSMDLAPADYQHHLSSAFVQDEIAVAASRGHLTLGTKLERHDFIGWTVQPTARFHWKVDKTQSAWAAVSRAMRAPDRLERSVTLPTGSVELPGGLTGVQFVVGNPNSKAEWLTAYEVGYRTSIGNATRIDLASYYNRYTGLRSIQIGEPSLRTNAKAAPFIYIPLMFANGIDATTAGGEALVTYAPQSFWKVTGSYTLFSIDTRLSDPLSPQEFEGAGTPRHQGQVRASASLPHAIDLDATLFAVAAIPELTVPAWSRLDTRIAWQPRPSIELSLTLQNLLNRRHREFGGATSIVYQFSDIPRTAYGGLTWRF